MVLGLMSIPKSAITLSKSQGITFKFMNLISIPFLHVVSREDTWKWHKRAISKVGIKLGEDEGKRENCSLKFVL